jgi:hypothetical protein
MGDELKIGIGIEIAIETHWNFLSADTEAMDGVRCASECECEAQITGSDLHFAD